MKLSSTDAATLANFLDAMNQTLKKSTVKVQHGWVEISPTLSGRLEYDAKTKTYYLEET